MTCWSLFIWMTFLSRKNTWYRRGWLKMEKFDKDCTWQTHIFMMYILWYSFFDPINPKSDRNASSLYNFTTLSNKQVMIIYILISKRILLAWTTNSCNKFIRNCRAHWRENFSGKWSKDAYLHCATSTNLEEMLTEGIKNHS